MWFFFHTLCMFEPSSDKDLLNCENKRTWKILALCCSCVCVLFLFGCRRYRYTYPSTLCQVVFNSMKETFLFPSSSSLLFSHYHILSTPPFRDGTKEENNKIDNSISVLRKFLPPALMSCLSPPPPTGIQSTDCRRCNRQTYRHTRTHTHSVASRHRCYNCSLYGQLISCGTQKAKKRTGRIFLLQHHKTFPPIKSSEQSVLYFYCQWPLLLSCLLFSPLPAFSYTVKTQHTDIWRLCGISLLSSAWFTQYSHSDDQPFVCENRTISNLIALF